MMLNLALLPPIDLAKQLEKVSRDLGHAVSSKVVLGEAGLAHVTVLQLHARETDADGLAKKFRTLAPPRELTLAGLCFVPGVDGETWVEVPVLKSRALAGLQAEAGEIARQSGHEVANAVGDAYRAHVTVALYEGMRTEPVAMDPTVLRRSASPWVLALGSSGEHFVFSNVLHTLS